MKKAILLFLFASTTAIAQVGINTSTPDASAALDVESTTGGFLPPRMTQEERDAITSPAEGLVIYQTNNSPGLYIYSGSWGLVGSNLSLQEKLDQGVTPWTLIDQGVLKSNLYGKSYQGGLIMYLDEITETGMVILDYNLKNNLCPPGNEVLMDYETSDNFGTGLSNSIKLQGIWEGASSCLNLIYLGYDDWYLPSIQELLIAFQNLPSGTLPYETWSSSQAYSSNIMRIKLLQGGSSGNGGPDFCYPEVRAVRTFN